MSAKAANEVLDVVVDEAGIELEQAKHGGRVQRQ